MVVVGVAIYFTSLTGGFDGANLQPPPRLQLDSPQLAIDLPDCRRHACQGLSVMAVIDGQYSPECLPVHPFWFTAHTVDHAGHPAQPVA